MARMKDDRKTPAFICTKIHLSAIWDVYGFYWTSFLLFACLLKGLIFEVYSFCYFLHWQYLRWTRRKIAQNHLFIFFLPKKNKFLGEEGVVGLKTTPSWFKTNECICWQERCIFRLILYSISLYYCIKLHLFMHFFLWFNTFRTTVFWWNLKNSTSIQSSIHMFWKIHFLPV